MVVFHTTMYSTIPILLLIISSLSFFIVSGDDFKEDSDSVHAHEEYSHIHRSIPMLFEYLLVALEGKPEVLENNNVVPFDELDNDENSLVKRHANSGNSDVLYKIDDDGVRSESGNNDKSTKDDTADNGTLNPKEIEQKILYTEDILDEHNRHR